MRIAKQMIMPNMKDVKINVKTLPINANAQLKLGKKGDTNENFICNVFDFLMDIRNI